MLGRALHRAPIVSPTTYHHMHRCTASAGALSQAPAMQPAVRACSTASTSEARTSNTREPGESGIDKHAAYVDEDGVVWPGPPEGTRKRTVALHIGYLGTNYYGAWPDLLVHCRWFYQCHAWHKPAALLSTLPTRVVMFTLQPVSVFCLVPH